MQKKPKNYVLIAVIDVARNDVKNIVNSLPMKVGFYALFSKNKWKPPYCYHMKLFIWSRHIFG